jgi:hypothetical protein
MTVDTADTVRLARKAVRALPGGNALGASRGDIADRAVAVGAVSAAGRPAFVALAEVNPEAALDAILAHTPASGPNTPATPVRAASRPSVAPDTAAVDPTAYPSGWGRAVAAAGRMARVVVGRPVEATADKTSLRQGQSGAAFQRAFAASEAERVEAERAGHPGYDDRSVKPSATAAAQQAAYEADQARMRAEQVARYGA